MPGQAAISRKIATSNDVILVNKRRNVVSAVLGVIALVIRIKKSETKSLQRATFFQDFVWGDMATVAIKSGQAKPDKVLTSCQEK